MARVEIFSYRPGQDEGPLLQREDEIERLYHLFNLDIYGEDEFHGSLVDRRQHLLATVWATVNDTVAGFGVLAPLPYPHEADLSAAYVSRPFTRQGLWDAMLSERMRIAKELKISRLRTTPAKTWLRPALIKRGFSPVEGTTQMRLDLKRGGILSRLIK